MILEDNRSYFVKLFHRLITRFVIIAGILYGCD